MYIFSVVEIGWGKIIRCKMMYIIFAASFCSKILHVHRNKTKCILACACNLFSSSSSLLTCACARQNSAIISSSSLYLFSNFVRAHFFRFVGFHNDVELGAHLPQNHFRHEHHVDWPVQCVCVRGPVHCGTYCIGNCWQDVFHGRYVLCTHFIVREKTTVNTHYYASFYLLKHMRPHSPMNICWCVWFALSAACGGSEVVAVDIEFFLLHFPGADYFHNASLRHASRVVPHNSYCPAGTWWCWHISRSKRYLFCWCCDCTKVYLLFLQSQHLRSGIDFFSSSLSALPIPLQIYQALLLCTQQESWFTPSTRGPRCSLWRRCSSWLVPASGPLDTVQNGFWTDHIHFVEKSSACTQPVINTLFLFRPNPGQFTPRWAHVRLSATDTPANSNILSRPTSPCAFLSVTELRGYLENLWIIN